MVWMISSLLEQLFESRRTKFFHSQFSFFFECKHFQFALCWFFQTITKLFSSTSISISFCLNNKNCYPITKTKTKNNSKIYQLSSDLWAFIEVLCKYLWTRGGVSWWVFWFLRNGYFSFWTRYNFSCMIFRVVESKIACILNDHLSKIWCEGVTKNLTLDSVIRSFHLVRTCANLQCEQINTQI